MKSRITYSLHEEGQRGFTLLLAALVASIVLSLGAAIYSIAFKQVTLSSIGRDSQFAFYAADTLAECALYYDVRLNLMSTTSPPATIDCNGQTLGVEYEHNTSSSSGGSALYDTPGSFNFPVPSDFGTLTVTVDGAGSGGGGGAAPCRFPYVRGNAGSAGGSSLFNSTVRGNGGGNTGTTPGNCSGAGQNGGIGSAYGGDTNIDGGGSSGGQGGNNSNGSNTAGDGGAGGRAVKTYTPSTLPPSSSVPVVVGTGGDGGDALTGSQAGFDGNSGRVAISWTGGAPEWNETVFRFQTEDTAEFCAIGTLTKTRVGNTVSTVIHVDGQNVSCDQSAYNPRALQRSVELKY